MAKKKYVSLTGIQYTFPVKVKDKYVWISFKGNENDYTTSNKDIQEAIEGCDKFKSRELGLFGGGKKNVEDGGGLEPKEFPEVTDPNDAVEILRKAPYGVHHSKIKSPEDIKTQAELCNVSFPNLVLE